MATQIQGKQLLLANYGPTSVKAATLPASGTTAIFNVVGGQVIITSLVGVITTAVQAQSTTLGLNVLNTAIGGGGTAITAATADLNAAAVGTVISLPLAGLGSGNALLLSAYGNQNNEFIVGAGSIRAVLGATSTGAWKWYCNYVSLDPGAYVAAA